MDITWHGNTCFTLKGKKASVVINPDKSIKSSLKGEIVLSSLGEETELAEVKDMKKTFDWPGEYEASEVPIIGLKAWTRSRSEEETGKKDEEGTIIFFFEIDGVKVCHLGGLGHKLTTELIDEIGDIDVLLTPVGDDSNLKGKTEVIIDQIDPRMVVLMGNSSPGAHAKEAGIAKLEEETDKLTIGSNSSATEEKTLYYALKKV